MSVYDMYPDWSEASESQRDDEEARQRRDREANGGMGFDSDYAAEQVIPLRPLSAGVAAVRGEVRLG